MLEILATAESLPVRILDPTLHHDFMGQVESVLGIGQPDHQPVRLYARESLPVKDLAEKLPCPL